jgi:hypothetical protein
MAKQNGKPKRDVTRRGKRVTVKVRTHRPTSRAAGNATGDGAAPKSTRDVTAAATVKHEPRTVQYRNVRADEVDSLIAEERATADVITVHMYPEGDGEFTVVIVYRQR